MFYPQEPELQPVEDFMWYCLNGLMHPVNVFDMVSKRMRKAKNRIDGTPNRHRRRNRGKAKCPICRL